MSLGIYKRGQGNWTRGVAAGGLAALGFWAMLETFSWIQEYTSARYWYCGYWVPAVLLLGFLVLAYWVSNRPKVADYLIETETEMKKVTWPTHREVFSATLVVIVVVVVMGIFLFGIDRVFVEPLFILAKVLPGEAAWWHLPAILGFVVLGAGAWLLGRQNT
jgi:preprotein translocase subunit SecE